MTEASPYDGTDEDLIEHMLEHIDDMECAVNDLYHHLFADRMRIHLRDMKNRCASHSSVTTSAEQVLGVVEQLYDAGFSNPLVTVECAIEYLKNPTVPGHPEKQRCPQRGEREP